MIITTSRWSPLNSAFTICACLLFLASGCKKDGDQKQPSSTPQPTLPVPTCYDTSDDGRLEEWNLAEKQLLGTTNYIYNDRVAGDYISWVGISAHKTKIDSPNIQISIKYKNRTKWNYGFYLVDQATKEWTAVGGIESKIKDDTMSIPLYYVYPEHPVTTGCKRLYYYFYEEANMPPRTIFKNGHFDIEMIN